MKFKKNTVLQQHFRLFPKISPSVIRQIYVDCAGDIHKFNVILLDMQQGRY